MESGLFKCVLGPHSQRQREKEKDRKEGTIEAENMGCCGSTPSDGGHSDYHSGNYQTADRGEMLRATEARIAQQENRGVSATAAKKLKENAKKNAKDWSQEDQAARNDATMKWNVET